MPSIRSTIAFERRAALALALTLATTLATDARADGRKAAAEALFREGKNLMLKKDFAAACPKLEESYRVDPALGTLLNLGLCHEALGKTATAWQELKEVRTLARAAGRADREKIANDHATALEPKLARVTIKLAAQAEAPSLEVKLDGIALGSGAWGSAIPVDPGDHSVEAAAPERLPWSSHVAVASGQQLEILIPPLAREVLPPPPPPPPPPAPIARWKKPVGMAAVGAGALVLGVGVFTGARAISLGNQSAAGCPKGVCTPDGYAAFQSGKANAQATDVLLPVGVIVAAVGVYLLVTSPSSSGATNTAISRSLSNVGRLEW